MILDGRNRARVIAEALARVIAAIQITSVCWRPYLPPKTQKSVLTDPAFVLCCDSNRDWRSFIWNRPNTVSASTVSNTELSEFFGAHWVPGSELSEFLSVYYLCAKAKLTEFSQNSPSLPRNSVRLSEFSCPKQYSWNSIPPVSSFI